MSFSRLSRSLCVSWFSTSLMAMRLLYQSSWRSIASPDMPVPPAPIRTIFHIEKFVKFLKLEGSIGISSFRACLVVRQACRGISYTLKDPSTPLRYALPLRAIKQDDAIRIIILLYYSSLRKELQVFLTKKTRLERIELPTRGFGDPRSTTEL